MCNYYPTSLVLMTRRAGDKAEMLGILLLLHHGEVYISRRSGYLLLNTEGLQHTT